MTDTFERGNPLGGVRWSSGNDSRRSSSARRCVCSMRASVRRLNWRSTWAFAGTSSTSRRLSWFARVRCRSQAPGAKLISTRRSCASSASWPRTRIGQRTMRVPTVCPDKSVKNHKMQQRRRGWNNEKTLVMHDLFCRAAAGWL